MKAAMELSNKHQLRTVCCCFSLMIAIPVALRGQATQPADLSSPAKTIATMFTAVNEADAATLKRTFLAGTPQTSELSSAYADLVVATRRLRDAARNRFSTEGANNPAGAHDGTRPGQPPPEQAAQLAAAEVKIDADQASVSIPDRPVPIKLKRVNGIWLIDLAEFAAGTPQQIGEQAELDRNLATAMKETTDEINAGRYASAQEAESAVQQKIHAVIAPPVITSQLKAISSTTSATTTPTR